MTTVTQKRKKGLFVFFCLFLPLLLMGLFVIYPMISIFRISLYKWGGYSPDKTFVGLDNYLLLFSDGRFLASLSNSLFLILTVSCVTVVLSLWCAAVLSRERLPLRGFFRVVLYVPNILSTVVIAAVFSALYDPSRGLINSFLSLFSKNFQPMWLGDGSLVKVSIAAAMIWQAVGYYMVIYLAAMSSVPKSLYEAAYLEGAGRVRCFFSITLPMIRGTLRTTLTFFIVSNLNISFLLVRAMTGGGPDGASEVLLSYMYKQAYTNSSYGYGMAIGVTVFLLSFALYAIANLITRKKD